jgi:hypothetical protein
MFQYSNVYLNYAHHQVGQVKQNGPESCDFRPVLADCLVGVGAPAPVRIGAGRPQGFPRRFSELLPPG